MNPTFTRALAGAILLATAVLHSCADRPRSSRYNLDFEYTNLQGEPSQWFLPDPSYRGYTATRDSRVRHHGQSSLRLEQTDTAKHEWADFSRVLPDSLTAGHEVELSGWIRTEEVTEGFADLALFPSGEAGHTRLTLDTLGRGVRGTTDWHRITLRRQIPDSASGISIGGMLKGRGRAWFDDFEIRIDGRRLPDPMISTPRTRLTRQEKRTLRKYLYPLRGCDPTEADSGELRLLDPLVGTCKVVALGENSHGASEIFRMKERLIRYLTTRQEFDQVVFEAGMGEGVFLDNYIRRGIGTAKAAIFGLGMWVWDTHEVLSLVEWMRQRNADGHPIRFWGIDMQMTDMTESLLRMALGKDTTAVQRLDEIGPKLDKVLTYDNEYRAQIDPRLAREIAQGLDAIESRIDPSVPDAHDRAMLRQWITLIRQYLGLGENIYWRDRCMANNLLWLRGQYPDSRIVLWAHNGHISKADDRLGRWLQDRLGADYVNFGFTFYRGRCSITVPDSEELQHDVQTAPPGTLEHLLHQLGEPIFILDLRQMREEQALALEWINGMRFRHIGALRWDNEFWDEGIADQFDYLIYIDRVTPSHLLF